MKLQLAEEDENGNPFPFSVFSKASWVRPAFEVQESFATRAQAIYHAEQLTKGGWVTLVTQDVAYTVG
jgi:hypothetical protein